MSLELLASLRTKELCRRERIRQETLEQVREALVRMREMYPFREAYIFGSLAVPYRFDPELSDVDVALEGLDRANLFKAVAFLSGELRRDVSLVLLEELGESPFKESILREGIRWKRP